MIVSPVKGGTISSISGHVKLSGTVYWSGSSTSAPCLVADDCHESGDSSP